MYEPEPRTVTVEEATELAHERMLDDPELYETDAIIDAALELLGF